jgi:hypothetical protein
MFTAIQKKAALAVMVLFGLSGSSFADTGTPGAVYDIQCGCYKEPSNARRLTNRLKELDPLLLFAVGNFETFIRNMIGDRERLKLEQPDPAQGMFQMLTSTARKVYQDMKNKNIPHTPDKVPKDLRTHPETQIYFAAHYLHYLHLREHGNRFMALLAYNSKIRPNFEYPRKVMVFYQRAVRYFLKASARKEKKSTPSLEFALEQRPLLKTPPQAGKDQALQFSRTIVSRSQSYLSIVRFIFFHAFSPGGIQQAPNRDSFRWVYYKAADGPELHNSLQDS